jgi:DNA-binding transcriptional regulator LsrR (DeoR family)
MTSERSVNWEAIMKKAGEWMTPFTGAISFAGGLGLTAGTRYAVGAVVNLMKHPAGCKCVSMPSGVVLSTVVAITSLHMIHIAIIKRAGEKFDRANYQWFTIGIAIGIGVNNLPVNIIFKPHQ